MTDYSTENTNCAKVIYDLQPVCDNPIFEGFSSKDAPSLLGGGRSDVLDDFYPFDPSDWNWELTPLSPRWKPLRVMGRVRPFNDFPCIAFHVPAFSRRAADGLRDLLEPNGELLPLVSDVGEYFAYNCLKVVAILNRDTSDAIWADHRRRIALTVDYFSIIPEKTKGLSIFRLREWPNHVLVTNRFVERARTLGLTGMEFKKLWPFPIGGDYEMEWKKELDFRGKKVRSPTGMKEVKGESLVIDFSLVDRKISKEEKKAINRFQDELDAQLVNYDQDAVYFGSLEGRSTSKGVTRLVLSCPDCQALLEKLKPWLESLSWPTPPRVFLRHGSWDDTAVDEIPASIAAK